VQSWNVNKKLTILAIVVREEARMESVLSPAAVRATPDAATGASAMSSSSDSKRAQIDKNYAAFKANLRELLEAHPGKQVLLHDGEIIEIFDTLSDAIKFGNAKFGIGNYTVQEVTNRPAELGWHSHALHYSPV
jgi:hypothetical protein